MSVVDRSTLVGKVDDSYDGVAMNGSVLRKVCWVVVGAVVVSTVGVGGLLHWSDIRTTVNTSAATNATPTTPATETTAGLRYHTSGC